MMFTPRRIFVWANFFLLIAYALVSFHPRIAYAYPYAAAVSYAAGNGPNSVFAADLDGDTDQDLAVANASDNNVSILLNSGSGTFAAAVNYAVGTIPASVFAADLDGDTDQDLAVANQSNDNVSILLNSGSGTFAAAVNYATGDAPFSIFAADLDGDTDRDLAVANTDSDDVSILLNSGSGTFAAAVSYAAGDGPYSIFAADLDGDTDRDLAVANQISNNVSILLNSGSGTFAAAVNYTAGSTVNSVFAADLDGDTDRDLAVANYSSNNVSILLNSGSGTFAAAVNYAAGTNPASVFAADLNGNTVLDLAVANGFSDDVSILLSTSNPVPTTTSISPTSKTAGDAQFTLTVNGANFIASSVVRFNGSDRTTAYVSSTQLTATIPASDLTTAGTYNITVFNPTPGGGESGAQTLTVQSRRGSTAPPPSPPPGAEPPPAPAPDTTPTLTPSLTLTLSATVIPANTLAKNNALQNSLLLVLAALLLGGSSIFYYWHRRRARGTNLFIILLISSSFIIRTSSFLYAETLNQGDTIAYHLVVANTGSASASNLLITAPIPANTTFKDGSVVINGIPSTLAPSSSILSANFASLVQGNSETMDFSVIASGETGALIQAQASASCTECASTATSNALTYQIAQTPAPQPQPQEQPAPTPTEEAAPTTAPQPAPSEGEGEVAPPAPMPVVQEEGSAAPSVPPPVEPIESGGPAPALPVETITPPTPTVGGGVVPEQIIPPVVTAISQTINTITAILTPALEPTPIQQTVESTITTALENLEQIAPTVAKPFQVINTKVLENPAVEQVALQVVVPTVVVTAAAAGVATATIPSFLPFLQYLFTQPLLLFPRRKRRGWGTVYNSISKVPVDLAIVRLIDAQTSRLIQTRVTDKYGRVAFLPAPGTYRLEVAKPNFNFPSTLLQNKPQDVQYSALYYGLPITIDKPGTLLAPNIPLDPNIPEQTPQAILQKAKLTRLNVLLGSLSILTSFLAFLIAPRLLAIVLVFGHAVIYYTFRRLAAPKKPKHLNKIKDLHTGQSLPGAIARIFDTTFNKLLETQVTDRSGKYGFLAGQNEYFITVEKPGYTKTQTNPIDLRETKEPGVVSVGVRMGKTVA